MPATPRLFVVSGPSGVGKGTVLARVREARPDLGLTVSATTRAARPGEVDGVAYHFLTDEEFDAELAAGNFLEWANVHGHRYGTLMREVTSRLERGQSLVLEIDVQGALNVRRAFPDAVLVFVEPPSLEALEARLRARGTEDEESLRLRLANAAGELELADAYDVRIVNDDLDVAVGDFLATLDRYETTTN
ncbi:MAG: guanylate kinase [Olsenella sp.]|nr:guanylate kinase [Olsenella sp.]